MPKPITNGMFITRRVAFGRAPTSPLLHQWKTVAEEVLAKPKGEIDSQTRQWAERLISDCQLCEFLINGDKKLADLAEAAGRVSEYGRRIVESRAASNVILGSKRKKALTLWHQKAHGSPETNRDKRKVCLATFIKVKEANPKKKYSFWTKETGARLHCNPRTVKRILQKYLGLSKAALHNPAVLKY